MSESRNRLSNWLDRWVFTLWTPILMSIVLAPIFWWARSGSMIAGWIVTIVIELAGALLIVSLAVKVWRDQKRSQR